MLIEDSGLLFSKVAKRGPLLKGGLLLEGSLLFFKDLYEEDSIRMECP